MCPPQAKVTIKCASASGQLYSLSGELFRKIWRRTDTLNENIDVEYFLRSTGYYDDYWDDLSAIAMQYSTITFSSESDLEQMLERDCELHDAVVLVMEGHQRVLLKYEQLGHHHSAPQPTSTRATARACWSTARPPSAP